MVDPAAPPCHALSVDVEDWYHDGGLPAGTAPGERVVANTERLLELFAAAGARATFFVLGEVATRHPELVRRIAAAGHEIGSHGHAHRHLSTMLSGELRADVARARAVLEDCIGAAVPGYRAPYFAIKADVRWPLAMLAEAGVGYDSSILPIDRPPGLELVSPRTPYRLPNGMWEVPVAVYALGPFWHLPLASGAGLRLLPPSVFGRALRRFEREVGSGTFYLHPWELDPESPTGPGPGRWLLRVGRERLAPRLAELLAARRFVPIAEAFPQVAGGAALPAAARSA